MTPDLEDRLARRLESRASGLPARPDRLNAVRSRGRRLRFRAQAVVMMLGLALTTTVVLAGVALFPGNETSTTEIAASSHRGSNDGDQRDRGDYRSSDRDRRGEGRTRHGKRTKRRTTRNDRRQFRYIVGPDSDVLAIPATSTTAASSAPESEDEVALGSDGPIATSPQAKSDTPKASGDPTDDSSKSVPSDSPGEKPSTTQPISKSTTDGRTSTPTDPSSTTTKPTTNPTTKPTTKPPVDAGLASIGNFGYRGAFRLSSEDFGASNSNYAVGTLAYNRANRSLFIAGHSHHNAIAEFAIPSQLGNSRSLTSLPVVGKPRQPFTTVLDRVSNPDGLDRITGLYVLDNSLVVNAERWYDASGEARDTTLVVSNASDLDSRVTGMYEMNGGAKAAGYMSPVPPEWQGTVGGSILTGWASNYSIISRYSQGPSMFGLDGSSINRNSPGAIATSTQMMFPHDSPLATDARETKRGAASPTWNFLSRGVYGFIVPGTRTFAVVGSSGGVDSGIGYKITQDNGNLCGGYCSYKAADVYNYYWLFDLDEIASAKDPSSPRPYDAGRWSVPFDGNGQHRINGATFDPESSTLYMSLDEAGQVGSYDRPPVIVAYQIK